MVAARTEWGWWESLAELRTHERGVEGKLKGQLLVPRPAVFVDYLKQQLKQGKGWGTHFQLGTYSHIPQLLILQSEYKLQTMMDYSKFPFHTHGVSKAQVTLKY